MTNPFSELLAEKGTLLADGATGTNLFEMGLMAGDAPELWNETAPEKITALYKGAVDAGSDVFLTNSFGANAARLKLHDAGHRAFELSKLAAEIARNVSDKAGRRVIVAGSVGPTGEIMEPVGPLSHAAAAQCKKVNFAALPSCGGDTAQNQRCRGTHCDLYGISELLQLLPTKAAWVGRSSRPHLHATRSRSA